VSLINSGFDGTVTERDFSRIMRGVGVRDSVETVAAWAVTQGTGRQVSVAPGVAYAAGVVSDSGVAILATLPTPVNGQWHLVVRRITWANNTVTVATIPHTTTTTTIPTAPPAGFPAFNDNTGVLVDQHLAWAWVRSTDTTVTVFDLRAQPLLRTIGVDLPVATFSALPTGGNFVGREITVVDTGVTYRWSGSEWQPFGRSAGTITPVAGFTTVGTDLLTKQGGMSRVSGSFVSNTDIATIPAGFRPPSDRSVACAFNNATTGWMRLDTAGNVRIFFVGAATNQVFATLHYPEA
jgi:hypothetical protein